MRLFMLSMLVEAAIFQEKVGPGVTRSDFLVVNKTDLAPYVGVDLERMKMDTQNARGKGHMFLQMLRQKKVSMRS